MATHGGIYDASLVLPEVLKSKLVSEGLECSVVPLEGVTDVAEVSLVKLLLVFKDIHGADLPVIRGTGIVAIAFLGA